MNRDESFEDLRNTANCFVELEKANKKIKELEEENKKSKNDIKLLLKENGNKEKVIKKQEEILNEAIKLTEELYKTAKEQDSDNVNLIDRLEIILKTLKGE